jgi:hypothetical protein
MANETPLYDEDALSTLEESTDEFTPDQFDQDADYAAPPPPLPDGWHQAKLNLVGAKDSTGTLKEFVGPRPWGNIPATFFTQIDATIVDPGGAQDGKRTDRLNVTTHPEERRNNASSASLVYKAITGDPIPGLKPGAHMALVLDQLRGQSPIVWIKTQLEGEAQEASKAFQEAKKAGTVGAKKPKTYRGEKSFSQEGKVTGRVFDPESGEFVVGRPAIIDMKPQSFQPPVLNK